MATEKKKPGEYSLSSFYSTEDTAAYSIAALVAAVVGDTFTLWMLILGLPLLLFAGAGLAVWLLAIIIHFLVGFGLCIYVWQEMGGPHEKEDYIEAGIETAANPPGILFSPRTVMVLSVPLFFIPYSLTVGLVWATAMHWKWVRFFTEIVVTGVLTGGGGAVATPIAETAGVVAGRSLGEAGGATAANVAGSAVGEAAASGAAGTATAGESAISGGAGLVRAGRGSEAGLRGPLAGVDEAAGVSESAFGMPEGTFETMERENLAGKGAEAASQAPELLSESELNAKNFYERLGVSPDADAQAVKDAYRQKVKEFHPDRHLDADTNPQMRSINEAYETLKNDELRAGYDPLGNTPKAARTGQAGTQPPAPAPVPEKAAAAATEPQGSAGEKIWDSVKEKAKEAAKLEVEGQVAERVFGGGHKEGEGQNDDDIDPNLDLREAA